MSVRVLIAVRGIHEGAVAATLDEARGVSVARRCADLGEALAAAHAGLAAVAVVSEQPQLNRATVAEFAAAGVALVGVPATAAGAEQLRAIGVFACLDAGVDLGVLPAIIENAAAQGAVAPAARPEEVPTVASRGSLIAVWGPTGAPGRTTLAVTIAHELSSASDATIVDGDTYGGAVAQALGLLDEAPGIAALARASLNGSLSEATFLRHALTVSGNLRVLTGITRPQRWGELSAAALDPVWELLKASSSVTVVDCGFSLERDEVLQYDTRAPQRNGATLSALAAADAVVVVGSSEPLGIQRLVHGLADLDEVVPADVTPRIVVVNKVRASVAGNRPREAVADALARYASVSQVWTVLWDPRGCDAATLAGQALGERSPRSPARKSIQAIARAAYEAAALEARARV